MRNSLVAAVISAVLSSGCGGGELDPAAAAPSASSELAPSSTLMAMAAPAALAAQVKPSAQAFEAASKISIYGDSIAYGGYGKEGSGTCTERDAVMPVSPSYKIAAWSGSSLSGNTGDDSAYRSHTFPGQLLHSLVRNPASSPWFEKSDLSTLLRNDTARYIVIRLGGNDGLRAGTASTAVGYRFGPYNWDDEDDTLRQAFADRTPEERFYAQMWVVAGQAIDIVKSFGKIPVIVGVPYTGYKTYMRFNPCADPVLVENKMLAATVANEVIKAVALRANVPYVELRGQVPFADDEHYSVDGIHPNPEYSDAMSAHINNAILAIRN